MQTLHTKVYRFKATPDMKAVYSVQGVRLSVVGVAADRNLMHLNKTSSSLEIDSTICEM